jgi:hypothetical protein
MRQPTQLELNYAQRIIYKRALMDIMGVILQVNEPMNSAEIQISRIVGRALGDSDNITKGSVESIKEVIIEG